MVMTRSLALAIILSSFAALQNGCVSSDRPGPTTPVGAVASSQEGQHAGQYKIQPGGLLAMLWSRVAAPRRGCVSSERPGPPRPVGAVASSQEGQQAGPYKRQPGALLAVLFAGEPYFYRRVRVDLNGQISLPAVTLDSRT